MTQLRHLVLEYFNKVENYALLTHHNKLSIYLKFKGYPVYFNKRPRFFCKGQLTIYRDQNYS